MDFIFDFVIPFFFEASVDAAMDSKRLKPWVKTAVFFLAGNLLTLLLAVISADFGNDPTMAADGVIAKVWDDALMGRCVAVSHGDGIFTFYKNLDPVLSAGIEADAEIKCGQQIGKVGESAIAELADEPHLHIEMTVNGLAVDPLDYFNEEAKNALHKAEEYESSAVTEAATEVIAEK